MDNNTYDVLNRSTRNSNETYSTLETISTNLNLSYETHRIECTNNHKVKSNDSKSGPNIKYLVVIIVMMVILLLTTIISLALSVAAVNQPKLEQSAVQSQHSKSDNDITAAPTQLTTTCNNLSQMLF